MKLNCLLFIIIGLLASNTATAQKSKSKKKPNKDVEVIDFGDDESSRKDDKAYKGVIIKTSPVSFIFGSQPFEIEKEITDYLSFQAGVGLTFLPILSYYDIFGEELSSSSDSYCESRIWANDECDYFLDNSIRRGKIGMMASISPRLFFGSNGFEGNYIAPTVGFIQRKIDVQKVREGTPELERLTDDYQAEKTSSFDIGVRYGYQTIYPKLTFEWFVGAGASLINSTRQDIGRDIDGNYGNGVYEFKDKRFNVEAGVRIGFQL